MRTLVRFAAAAMVTVAAAGASANGTAKRNVTFSYEDSVLLQPGEKNGGLAYLTDGVGKDEESAALVVFLHGLNDFGPVHFWYGLSNTDLRPIADEIVASGKVRPFVLAAPSQTRHASVPTEMWADFDLDEFVFATEAALPDGVTIDPDAIVVVGHSGGGCNPKGGLLGTLSPFVHTQPAGIVAVDNCFDPQAGTILGSAPPGTPVWVFYQPFTWWRDFDLFRGAFEKELDRVPGRQGTIVVETKNGNDPHNQILERALREALPALLPKETPDPYE
jgi:hypothetical protein